MVPNFSGNIWPWNGQNPRWRPSTWYGTAHCLCQFLFQHFFVSATWFFGLNQPQLGPRWPEKCSLVNSSGASFSGHWPKNRRRLIFSSFMCIYQIHGKISQKFPFLPEYTFVENLKGFPVVSSTYLQIIFNLWEPGLKFMLTEYCNG